MESPIQVSHLKFTLLAMSKIRALYSTEGVCFLSDYSCVFISDTNATNIYHYWDSEMIAILHAATTTFLFFFLRGIQPMYN